MNFRFVMYFILLLIGMFSELSRNTNNLLYGRTENNDYNSLSFRLLRAVRRYRASRKSKKFLKKEGTGYTLANDFVIFIYDPERKIFFCRNKRNRNEKATYDFQKQHNYDLFMLYEMYDRIFDEILFSFDENANYGGITMVLNEYFDVTSVVEQPKKVLKTTDNKMRTVDDFFKDDIELRKYTEGEKLNVNLASADELNKLPGINVVLAKRILKYRETNNAFKSIDEFYNEMKIKPHFRKRLNSLICTDGDNSGFERKSDSSEIQPEISETSERVIPENDDRVINL